MLSELIRKVYDNAAIDWATAEKVVYSMLVYMEEKLPPGVISLLQAAAIIQMQ